MGILIARKGDASRSHWSWKGKGPVVGDENFTEGRDVRCLNYQYPEQGRSFVLVKIRKNKSHGWTKAASDYFYFVQSGSCDVEVKHDKSVKVYRLMARDSFCIKAGTVYNYIARSWRFRATLFMNNLWKEEDE